MKLARMATIAGCAAVLLSLSASGATGRFDLHVNDVSGLDAPWPLIGGLPFPEGEVSDPACIRIVNAKGREVPAQIDVAATWHDGSIVDNAAGTEGGGIYAEQDVLIITNSIFRTNVAETTVGGAITILSNNNVTWRLLNCTLSGNNGYNGAGRSAFYVRDGGTGCLLSISNSVLYGNGTLYDVDDIPDTGWVVSFHHNVIGSIANPTDVPDFAANSNITANPLFVDAANGDFRLQETSPAVNTGTNQPAWMTDAVDLDDNPRIDWWGLVVDRGCYERTPPKPKGTAVMIR